MKSLCFILIGLFCLISYSQNSEESYLLLSKRKDSLLFSFFTTSSPDNVLLETKFNKPADCNTINPTDSQKIVDIFNELGLLESDYLIPADNPEFDYSFDDSTKLLVIVGRDNFDYYLVLRKVEIAKELLTKIGTELNIADCFIEIMSKIKT